MLPPDNLQDFSEQCSPTKWVIHYSKFPKATKWRLENDVPELQEFPLPAAAIEADTAHLRSRAALLLTNTLSPGFIVIYAALRYAQT
jgi:hypothetical protein